MCQQEYKRLIESTFFCASQTRGHSDLKGGTQACDFYSGPPPKHCAKTELGPPGELQSLGHIFYFTKESQFRGENEGKVDQGKVSVPFPSDHSKKKEYFEIRAGKEICGNLGGENPCQWLGTELLFRCRELRGKLCWKLANGTQESDPPAGLHSRKEKQNSASNVLETLTLYTAWPITRSSRIGVSSLFLSGLPS